MRRIVHIEVAGCYTMNEVIFIFAITTEEIASAFRTDAHISL